MIGWSFFIWFMIAPIYMSLKVLYFAFLLHVGSRSGTSRSTVKAIKAMLRRAEAAEVRARSREVARNM